MFVSSTMVPLSSPCVIASFRPCFVVFPLFPFSYSFGPCAGELGKKKLSFGLRSLSVYTYLYDLTRLIYEMVGDRALLQLKAGIRMEGARCDRQDTTLENKTRSAATGRPLCTPCLNDRYFDFFFFFDIGTCCVLSCLAGTWEGKKGRRERGKKQDREQIWKQSIGSFYLLPALPCCFFSGFPVRLGKLSMSVSVSMIPDPRFYSSLAT